MDRRARWAIVHGAAESRTPLKRLSTVQYKLGENVRVLCAGISILVIYIHSVESMLQSEVSDEFLLSLSPSNSLVSRFLPLSLRKFPEYFSWISSSGYPFILES